LKPSAVSGERRNRSRSSRLGFKRLDETLRGFFGGSDAIGTDCNAMFGRLQIHIQQNSVVNFGLRAQNFPFVYVLFAFFGGLFAGVFLGLALLRNKANFRLSAFRL
jgi:hypothetical protein